MDKIIVLKVSEGDPSFEWNRGVDIMKKYLHTGYPIQITDEEMECASKLLDESSIVSRDKEIGFMNCWNYIKSRINQ